MVFEYSLRTVKDDKGNERGAITICYDESSVPSDKMIKIDDIVRGQGILVQEYFNHNADYGACRCINNYGDL